MLKRKALIDEARQRLAARQGQRDLLQGQLRLVVEERERALSLIALLEKVQILLQKTSDFARLQAKGQIEEIVTSALSVVFGKDYKFAIALDVKGKAPVAEYWLNSDGISTQLKPPDYNRGGGAVDVISLALRLAIGELCNIEGPIILDEVGKHVSAEYATNVAYFLREYSQKFNRQILLITHNEALAEIGEVSLQVSMRKGKSEVMTL